MTDETLKTVWVFEPDRLEKWAFWDKLFTKEECQNIIDIGKALRLEEGSTAGPLDPREIRKSNVGWIFPATNTYWIFQRITDAVLHINAQYFNFDLYGLVEGFQFTEYIAPDGHYARHTDLITGSASRKISVTIQLSDDSDYEGGELMLHYGPEAVKAPTDQGKAIVFPSFLLHEVKPVTKGTRYSLVCWITGKAFK
jgi:PKHD-type hydroxylase